MEINYKLIFLLAIISCNSNNLTINNQPPYPNKDLMNNSDIKVSCKNFKERLRPANVLPLIFLNNNLDCECQREDSNQFHLICKGKFSDNKIIYSLYSNEIIYPPYLYNFNHKNYLSSSISIDADIYALDSIKISPELGVAFNHPVQLMSMGYNYSFVFDKSEYVVFDGYLPCNGRFCNDHYILFWYKCEKTNGLSICRFEDEPPFSSKDFVLGDVNNDKYLEVLIPKLLEDQKVRVEIFSLINGQLVPYYNKKNEASFIEYHCFNCIGEENDSLTILNHNLDWF